jgi:hypothetical protein
VSAGIGLVFVCTGLISRVRRQVGRKRTPKEVRELIFRMVVAKPTWGATLFFTAGINNEQDGLFGTLTPLNGLDGDEEWSPRDVLFSYLTSGLTAEAPVSLPFFFQR